ncbi:MAG: sigma-70 family RNA polymerase sigma factor [Actinobacteria bacterium]|nr:sigma-70 family RNA polymerase sigma factor [Actinomycetota bacterium]
MAVSLSSGDAHPSVDRDARSFDELFVTESAAMLRLAIGLVDVPERAEEIVQDAFEKTLLAWGRLREPGALLRTAAVNGCRTELRRRRVMRRHPLVAPGSVELGEADAALLAAVAGLTPQRRIAITLRYYADLTEADIAETMGVRVGTVKSLISRGLADLRASHLRSLQP